MLWHRYVSGGVEGDGALVGWAHCRRGHGLDELWKPHFPAPCPCAQAWVTLWCQCSPGAVRSGELSAALQRGHQAKVGVQRMNGR